jgi:RimK family alpha-L-glutamate ligase
MPTVWILSKRDLGEYENSRLVLEFEKCGVETQLIHPDRFDLLIGSVRANDVILDQIRAALPDAVLVRTGSGTTYFGLSLMRQLELVGVPVINSSQSIGLVKDKMKSSQVLSQKQVPIPRTLLVRYPVNQDLIHSEIGWPCVIKVVTGSYGKGVYLCQNQTSFGPLMDLIESLESRKTLIIQQYIGHRVGTDLRVWVIGGVAVAAMLRSSPTDFRANISAGGTGTPYPLTAAIVSIAEKAAEALGLSIAGIDLLFADDSDFKVCEANSAPGFEGMETYCHINMARPIVEYVMSQIDQKQKLTLPA